MEKISVIIPVYNVKPEYFENCISSLISQTHERWEAIIVDDGSDEYTAWCCDRFAESEPRIRVFHQENAGASAARNKGLEKCTGDYVTFVDCDDWIAQDCLSLAIERMKEDELDILLWGSYKLNGNRRIAYAPYDADIRLFDEKRKKELMLKTMVGSMGSYTPPATVYGSGSCCSKLYRRSFLIENELKYPVGIERAEDVNFNIRAFDAAERIGYLNRHLYFYRQHNESATYRYRHDGIAVFTAALACLDEFLKSTNKDEDFRQAYYMRCMFFFLESMDMDYLNPANKESRSESVFRMQRAAHKEPYRTAIKKLSYNRLSFLKRIPLFFIRHDMMGLLRVFYSLYKLV